MASTVLVVTALEDVTADLVIASLNERGVPVVRIDPAQIGDGLRFGFRVGQGDAVWAGCLATGSRTVELGEVAAVYHRRPTPYATRFAQLPQQVRDFAGAEARHGLSGVLHHLHAALYVNHPHAVARAEFKPAQLHTAGQMGLRVPATLITNDPDAAWRFAEEYGPVVYKTFRGLPRSDDGRAGAIWTQRVDPATFDDSLAVTAHLFQAEVPKQADIRVTVVGGRLFAQQVSAPGSPLDWRRGDWDALVHTPVGVSVPVEAALFRYLLSFGLVFGCFDFALTGPVDDPGSWAFIECNPNGQWGWLPDAREIAEAFADVLSRKEAAPHGPGHVPGG
ncbi:ATP-grasp ribosomal peptide maturase [Streptomyces sp. JJ66]|uniref:ATP-grasp ribosomal peptide maturase n=1 Tax=Streptomyces sp. JJ66 TaxID=2803843 RepID=UPI001C56F750|nr:ATP-grasp ribosomal peptide maturase [Streptomyces sp. JJ66]MBW1603119.1 ATP-grasp ribosomal peptide maturase [Streptomyces sp. JJ66]